MNDENAQKSILLERKASALGLPNCTSILRPRLIRLVHRSSFIVHRFLILSVICLLTAGCAGYHVGAQTLYPPDIHTVYVPIFESDSFRRNLGERLTEAVAKQIEARTPYKVVGGPQADSVLTGRLINDTKRVIVEDTNDQPRETEVNLVVQVSWVDRKGDLVGRDAAVPVPVQLSQSGTLIPEYGQSGATAQQDAIDKLARQIVGMMELPPF